MKDPQSAFRQVPRTGVIYVTTEATGRGYHPGDPEWCNLGQGQPETGPLPGGPPRVVDVHIIDDDHEYAPVPGLWELREAVASFYNRTYRRGMPSQYSAENVCISGGGRASLTRAAASLGHINLGHFLPDYTAYEELLEQFRLFSPIPILLEGDRGYEFTPAELRREILGRGLGALLVSNPTNPTGKLVGGEELREWVSISRELDCCLLLDEFYSHYIWRDDLAIDGMASAARYVEDVERDPVVIFDGLTKNWRCPGWRVTWSIGPRRIMDSLGSSASFLDGGGCRPMQRAAIPLLEDASTRAETEAIRRAFAPKRQLLLDWCVANGLRVDRPPEGTFYVWAALPDASSDGLAFFRAALDEQVIVVPGAFFDVNPGKRRAAGRFRPYVRLSFGPPMLALQRALPRLTRALAAMGSPGSPASPTSGSLT